MTKYFDKTRPAEVILAPGEYPHYFFYFVLDYYDIETGKRNFHRTWDLNYDRLEELYSLVDKVEYDAGWGITPLLHIRGNEKSLRALEILNE